MPQSKDSDRYIFDLIREGEHLRQDFKFEITDSRKIARTLSAFSNTGGGKLLIGVKDNGNITGVTSDEEYHMIEAAAQLYSRPEVPFTPKKWHIRGKDILEIDIPRTDNPPVLAQSKEGLWQAYVRVADQNILASVVHLNIWKKKVSKRGILFRYEPEKKILLDYLQANPSISLSKYSRVAKIQRKTAADILAELVVLDVLNMEFSEQGARFSLGGTEKE